MGISCLPVVAVASSAPTKPVKASMVRLNPRSIPAAVDASALSAAVAASAAVIVNKHHQTRV